MPVATEQTRETLSEAELKKLFQIHHKTHLVEEYLNHFAAVKGALDFLEHEAETVEDQIWGKTSVEEAWKQLLPYKQYLEVHFYPQIVNHWQERGEFVFEVKIVRKIVEKSSAKKGLNALVKKIQALDTQAPDFGEKFRSHYSDLCDVIEGN